MIRNGLNAALVVLVAAYAFVHFASGQDDSLRMYGGARSGRFDVQIDPDIPPTALRSEEGRRLAGQLQNLRMSESNMGANHPSLGVVQAEIKAVKRQLATFAPTASAEVDSRTNPFREREPPLTEERLRSLVLEMATRMQQLERRIFVLERRLGTIEQ